MLLAPRLGAPPREVAERLGEALRERLGERVEQRRGRRARVPQRLPVRRLVHGRGGARAGRRRRLGRRHGRRARAGRRRVRLRQPDRARCTAASGRHAAYGDALARLLEFAGHEVSREYYFNDAGGQLIRLGESIRARARGEAVPEDGYQGEYVAELAAEIAGRGRARRRGPGVAGGAADDRADQGDARALPRRLRHLVLRAQRCTRAAPIERAFERVEEAGHAYRSEGALWLRTTDFGDDKDRVIVRSTGEPTYFASDVAYLEDKLERGFERLITLLGADHHGYVPRFKAALAALGGDPDRLEIPILQFVHLVERGERASMSKRARRVRHARRPGRPRSASTPRATSCSSARTTRRSTSTSTSRARSRPRTPSTTSSTRTRGSPRSCARRASAAPAGRGDARAASRPSAS